MTTLEFRESEEADWAPVFGDYPNIDSANLAVINLNAMVGFEKYRVLTGEISVIMPTEKIPPLFLPFYMLNVREWAEKASGTEVTFIRHTINPDGTTTFYWKAV